MINSLFKSLASFQGCCIQQLTQEERNGVAAKQILIFRLSSINKRTMKSLIIKFISLIKYLQMITKFKLAASLVIFHQSLH